MQTVNDVLSRARADAVEALLEPDVDVALARTQSSVKGYLNNRPNSENPEALASERQPKRA